MVSGISSGAQAVPLYQEVADKIVRLIEEGVLRPGERVSSLRKVSEQYGVSVTTAIQAFILLEDRGLVEARPKSGFFVRVPRPVLREPAMAKTPRAITAVTVGALQSRLFEAAMMPHILPLGGAVPSPELLPTVKLNRILASVARRAGKSGISYDMPPGSEALRREIAKRTMNAGATILPQEIITTSGATEALMLCLRAVTVPGNVVAVESPTYFGVLHALEELGLKAIEVPTHPRDGMDLDALERMLKTRNLAACLAVPTFSNPLGALMPDEGKERLVRMLEERQVPLIEDDVFGELHHGPHRPRLAKGYDQTGNVLLCSSFSKSLAPGYRVGWVAPGRFYERIKTLKLTSTLATATLPELAIAEFLANGGYDHYLRSARSFYAANVQRVGQAVAAAFPEGTKVTQPQGGFVIWVEMPAGVDALRLQDDALAHEINIAPGPMFSPTQGYKNCIRLSCGVPWTPRLQQAIQTLGKLAQRQL
ncbi:GntR family transcriptional regulator [Prosthecobacter fusiformis]|uniref:GntR family transcriptional regulator n=1 Tax=Prosthecobacter fusiformis TaxID=48464 RepID=A0A4R7S233_9BACT|nr:PLP-dependent aminotransferase family protein [Prosthecobacter fusiformis]TDU71285.1 GntR family transcriptional regulator [Prosthecobacter fusiformis]